MAEEDAKPAGPDLTKGIVLTSLPEDGMLVGHVGDEDVLVVRSKTDIFALAAHCTHYHGPLAEGLVVDGTVRCPRHHACFGLRRGQAPHAPALYSLATWELE